MSIVNEDPPEQRPCTCAGCGRLLPKLAGVDAIEVDGFRSRTPAYCSDCVAAGLSNRRPAWVRRVYGDGRKEA